MASSSDADELERYTVDGVGRFYIDGDQWLPSVSTVMEMRPTPPALKRWLENTDNADEINTYKQNRGTVFHYDCLQQLIPLHPDTGDPVRDMWSEDEQSSIDAIRGSDREAQFDRERDWIESAWDLITDVQNITRESVIDIETYVTNHEIGYGGQFDLLYQDESADETVLADIKTGKYVYDKNMIQLVAYKNATQFSIDRMEILRMNPDKQDWTISSSHEWLEDEAELWDEFVNLRGKLEAERIDAMREQVKQEVENDSGNALIESFA